MLIVLQFVNADRVEHSFLSNALPNVQNETRIVVHWVVWYHMDGKVWYYGIVWYPYKLVGRISHHERLVGKAVLRH